MSSPEGNEQSDTETARMHKPGRLFEKLVKGTDFLTIRRLL
jgi:hypothetical protein